MLKIKNLGLDVLVGAAGGLAGFAFGEFFWLILGGAGDDLESSVAATAAWMALVAAALGMVLLAHDNASSLRGHWSRDLVVAALVFTVLGAVSGALAQNFYFAAIGALGSDSWFSNWARSLGWAMMGTTVGLGIGVVRRDALQALRGAIGGGLGAGLGGLIFNTLAAISSAGDGLLPRGVGLALTGAAMALGIRLIQTLFRGAQLFGIAPPYEGRSYPLNKARVSVGRDASNDLSLFANEILPRRLGEFVFQNGTWNWQGAAISIDGQNQTQAPLANGATLEFGGARFRFRAAGSAVSAATSNAPMALQKARFEPRGHEFSGFDLNATKATVGRAPLSDWTISAATISSQHARLELQNGVLRLFDLDSTNGTLVNGQKIGAAGTILKSGDVVKFGDVEFEVRRGT